MRKFIALTALIALTMPSPAMAWGFETHKFIVSRAIDILPEPLRPFFEANRAFIANETLANVLNFDAAPDGAATDELQVDGENIAIGLRKAP